jgi:signal transduction histidine kinase
MKRILVLEDDEMFRRVICDTLRKEGYQVYESGDGAAGLELAREQLPDLILADILMPGLNGTEVLTALRADQHTAVIPFILMTSETDKVSMRVGMGLGADDYLAKPFSPRVLLEAVKTRLKRHEQMQERAEEKMETLRASLSTTLPHELLTPLAGILGYAEMIRLDFDTLRPGDIMEMTWGIEKCAQRLQRLIQNYLLYADMELLRKQPEQLRSSPRDQVTHSRKIVWKVARCCALRHSRQDDLEADISDGPVPMGENYLTKLVEELVDNACLYSSAKTPIKIAATHTGAEFLLRVSDQGRGMTPQQIKEIGAFKQFDRRKYEQQGMGLGLFLCKRLAELYDGAFQIHSEPGKGTTAEIRLPVAR